EIICPLDKCIVTTIVFLYHFETSALATACISPIDGIVTQIEDSTLPGRNHFQGVPASYGLRRGEIICSDTPKEVTRSPGEVSSIRKCLRSTTTFPNTYIERQRITRKVAQPVAHASMKLDGTGFVNGIYKGT
ncbi:hypothetical protein Tco_1396399, partial [Tanacetum coccineum]